MFKKLSILFIFLLLTGSAMAGVTGKIAGKITDRETGDPLPGVNVVIEGTSMGAATDINGNYVILNVPPGVYRLKATMIGYTAITVENVRVSIDITTKLNFELTTEVLDVEGTVTIVAERPMIQKDEVSTRHFVSADDIAMQPVDSFEDIAKNQAGVVGTHFRGGRSGEVLVLIDGIAVRDPAGAYSDGVVNFSGFTSDIPEYGIQEMEVSLGGFSAEYGNVQSGILNLAMKEGRNKYSGRARFTSTDFGYPDVNTDLLKDIYEFNLSGPEPLTKYLLPSIGLNVPGDLSLSLSAEITDKDRGYYMNQQDFNQSYQGKLTYRINPNHKLAFGGVFSNRKWDQYYFPASKYGPGSQYEENEYYSYDNLDGDILDHYIYVNEPHKYRDQQGEIIEQSGVTPDGSEYNSVRNFYVGPMQDYLWDRTQKSTNGYVIWTHTLSSRTFYEIRLNNFYSNYHYATPDVDDRDGDGNADEDLVWDPDLPGPHPIYRERENNYWWVRGDDPGHRDQESWTRSVKADIVSQVTPNHMLKGGLEFYHHRTKVENISWTLGYGIFRKDIWDRNSVDVGAYFQDKIEFAGIIGLVGLRFDMFDPSGFGDDVFYPTDYEYPYSQFDEDGLPVFSNPKKAELKYQFSPRLGISHPITDQDVLHFTYGHYFQRPDAYFLFRNYKIQSLTKVGNYIGNPDLNPEKTVAYEIGIEHQFASDMKGTVTGYYKDVTNLMNWQKYVGKSIQNTELNVYTNADYGNIKGLEFTLTKRPGRFWGASVNYTFSVAKGRSSDYYGGYGSFTDVKRMNILDYDQTHTINANITLRTPNDFGPAMGQFRPLAQWTANFQTDYGSGLPYSSYGTGKINDLRRPYTTTTDVKLIRHFEAGTIKYDLFIDVFNLFDRENIEWLGSNRFYELKDDPSIVRQEIDGSFIRNPQVYSDGRQVRFGLAVQF